MTDLPDWVSHHRLEAGAVYLTTDSDLRLEFVGCAQVHDPYGFRIVMVFRDIDNPGMLLTIGENEADASAGFLPLGDQLLESFDDDN